MMLFLLEQDSCKLAFVIHAQMARLAKCFMAANKYHAPKPKQQNTIWQLPANYDITSCRQFYKVGFLWWLHVEGDTHFRTGMVVKALEEIGRRIQSAEENPFQFSTVWKIIESCNIHT